MQLHAPRTQQSLILNHGFIMSTVGKLQVEFSFQVHNNLSLKENNFW